MRFQALMAMVSSTATPWSEYIMLNLSVDLFLDRVGLPIRTADAIRGFDHGTGIGL